MSIEIERLKSKLEYCETLINFYDSMNFTFKTNKYDKKIEEYQNKLTDVYKRIQDLKEENK